MSLQYIGIQKFKRVRASWALPVVSVLMVFGVTVWFHVLHPNVHARAVLNSLIYAVINIACARLLLVPAAQPLKTAYRFTGTAFLILAAAFLYRAANIYFLSPDSADLHNLALSPGIFFIGSMTQMCLTFGFVLILNYRLVTDLQTLAVRDPLTGILNRRSLEDEAGYLLARCERNNETMTLMMIDVDHFKAVNDQYGHQVGDEVLMQLVEIVSATIRTGDYFARYGGEEFCVMLPLTTQDDALILAERLRQKYADAILIAGTYTIRSTISIGITDTQVAGLEFRTLVSYADQALYQAKKSGRNRVELYSAIV
jgi:diguanylate cyclase (GGDEF)-like protein